MRRGHYRGYGTQREATYSLKEGNGGEEVNTEMKKDNEKRRTNLRTGGHETRSVELNIEIRKENEATY